MDEVKDGVLLPDPSSVPNQDVDNDRQAGSSLEENLQEENKKSYEPFKKPIFIGPQRGKIKKIQNYASEEDTEKLNGEDEMITRPAEPEQLKTDTEKVLPKKQEPQNTKPLPLLPYKEPEWGGLPLQEYKLEELKSGTIVKMIELKKRSFFVFGRLENCDIAMLHPTVSRYHAVLQYRAAGDMPGFYIYDLGSSLGTFLNKQKLQPKIYVRVKVGHMLKIGCSTRMFVLQGPPEDEEPELDMTVTELKQLQQDKRKALEEERARLEVEEEQKLKREEERGIDWGMGEDADEETDLTENPYATTQNEELYLDDPKKTLRGWFEREGEELVYDVEEKGFGHFICRIELPVDNETGKPLVAEASVKGKKKEAVVQAALEACRLLDRQGLLRQATHESKKRAAKDWEAEDFYDSDDDNFLDRTGQIEKKRRKRMAESGKLERPVETYESLVEKYKAVVKDLEETESRLTEMLMLATEAGRQAEGEDELDAFMSTLNTLTADKIQIKKMKDEVARLHAEEARLRNLVNIARPTDLPKLERAPKSIPEKKLQFPHFIGKMSTKKKPRQETVLPRETTQQQSFDAQEEFDEEEPKEKEEETDKTPSNEEEVVKKKKRSRTDTRKRHEKRQPQPLQMDDEDYSNCTWKPPSGQTGDGRTALNDKLGY